MYFELPEIPGRLHFKCDVLKATLAVSACSQMWKSANYENTERLHRCKCCPIGAKHSGETSASMSPLLGKMICGRCHRGAERLIEKHLCISCWNRQREYKLGKNARGQMPKLARRLDRRQLRYFAGGDARILTIDYTVDTTELIVAVLRSSKKHVTFSFQGLPGGIAQRRLF